jgi:putative flippase GtrA
MTTDRRTAAAARRVRVHEVVGFGAVGAVAFVAQVGLFNLLGHSGSGLLSSDAVAMVASVLVAYVGSRYLTFGHRKSRRVGREAAAFLLTNAVAFIAAELIMSVAYPFGAQRDHLVVNLLDLSGIALGSVLRFWAYQRFVFPTPEAVRPDRGGAGSQRFVPATGPR